MSFITSLFKRPKISLPPVIQTPVVAQPPVDVADLDTSGKAAEAARERLRKALAGRGRAATLLTGPLGAPEDDSSVKKVLLGQ